MCADAFDPTDRRRDFQQRREIDDFRARVTLHAHWASFAPGEALRCPVTKRSDRRGTDRGWRVCATYLHAHATTPLIVTAVTDRAKAERRAHGATRLPRCPGCGAYWFAAAERRDAA